MEQRFIAKHQYSFRFGNPHSQTIEKINQLNNKIGSSDIAVIDFVIKVTDIAHKAIFDNKEVTPENSKFVEELEKTKAHLMELMAEVDKKNIAIATLEDAILQLEYKSENKGPENNKTAENYHVSEGELLDLQEKLSQSEAKYKELEENHLKLVTKYKSMQEDSVGFVKDNLSDQKILVTLENENKELQKQLASVNNGSVVIVPMAPAEKHIISVYSNSETARLGKKVTEGGFVKTIVFNCLANGPHDTFKGIYTKSKLQHVLKNFGK